MAVNDTFFESEGKSIDVTLTGNVTSGQLIYNDGWLGIALQDGVSGDVIAIDISWNEFQFEVPAALDVSKGDVVYIDTAQVTGGKPDAAGYAKAAGAGLIPAFKATEDEWSNNVVPGILMSKAV